MKSRNEQGQSNHTDFDCAVVGGGPAGATTALRLARLGRRVLLVDRGSETARRVGESLPAAARPLLRHLGLLEIVESGPHLPSYGNCSAWGSDQLMATDFILDPNGLGWHLDRAKFDRDLRLSAINAGVDFIRGHVDHLEEIPNGWRITSGASEFQAKWIVDATGRSAQISKKLGATRQRDDQLMALYAWAQPSRDDRDTRTLIESAPNGWWYTSRLADGTRVIAFHTDADRVAEVLGSFKRSNEPWEESLHIRTILRGSTLVTDWSCAEASGARLSVFTGRNWLATGDAALSLDPLSSQGIFNSLYCGMKAGEAVHRALEGDSSACLDYVSRLEAIRGAYLANHRSHYLLEQRWSGNEFWCRRQKSAVFTKRDAS